MYRIPISASFVAASLLLSPAAALSATTSDTQSASQPAAAANQTAAAPAEKKICRQLPSSTSRLPERVCLTAKEWKQVDQGS